MTEQSIPNGMGANTVTKKVDLPYTVVEEALVFENSGSSSSLMDLMAEKVAQDIDSEIMSGLAGGSSNSPHNQTLTKEKKKTLWSMMKDKMKKPGSLYMPSSVGFIQEEMVVTQPPTVVEVSQLAYQLNVDYEAWEDGPELPVRYAIGTVHEYDGKKFNVVEHVKNIQNKRVEIKMLEVIVNPHTGKNITTHGSTMPQGESMILQKGDGSNPWTKVMHKHNTDFGASIGEVSMAFTPKTDREKMFAQLCGN